MSAPVLVTAYQVRANGPLGTIIPKPLREKLRIVKGTKLVAYEDSGKLVLQRFDSFKGYSKAVEDERV
jgi:bifunctional DNA-binding transcriptional regulator/antitoxin component of YhaV-PrlF toxin-antitoxin module